MSDEDNANGEAGQDEMAADWAAAMAEQDDGPDAAEQPDLDALATDQNDAASRAEFDELTPAVSSPQIEGAPDLDVILDIPVRISMEVGNTDISIRNLLQLNQGSVVELDRLAGEPLDVLVNGTLIAHGEVVVVNEKFGIRMTDVISPSERIKKLR